MSFNKSVSSQNPTTKVGDRYKNSVGQWCVVVEYTTSKNVLVVFDEYPNNKVMKMSGELRRGSFRNPADPMNMLRKVFKNKYGESVVVAEYNSATDVIVVFEDGLRSKTTTSYLKSGVFIRPDKHTSLVGKRFKNKQGDYCTVVEYISATNIVIEFDGYLNNLKQVSLSALQKGSFKNNYKPTIYGKGYLGDGKYQGSKKDGTDFVYGVWNNMLARNYDPYTQSKQPAYIGCSVCDEWLCLQNFADWYMNHPSYGLGYNLDKDLLGEDDKVYSPETCTMLPPDLNVMISGSTASKNGMPLGVNKVDNGYVARLSKGKDGREYLGYYKTAEEAHNTYVEAKERFVKNNALKWANRIEWRAYKALMEWTVYPK